MENAYTKLNRKEQQQVRDLSKTDWLNNVVGKRPTFRSQARLTPGGIKWDGLRIIAALLFVLVVLYSGMKASLHAAPVADELYTALVAGHDLTDSFLTPSRDAFVGVMRLVMIALSELGIVYFGLLAVEMGKLASAAILGKTSFLDPKRILGYLPRLTFFLLIGYVVYISSAGDNVSPFDRFLPVIVGVGLTLFVEDLVQKSREHAGDVVLALVPAQAAWDARVAAMNQDVAYNTILPEHIWEVLLSLWRVHPVNKKRYQPNLGLEFADADVRSAIIEAEYRRLTVNLKFAETVLHVEREQQAYVATNTGNVTTDGKRMPPDGIAWTPETMWADLESIRARKPLRREDIRTMYEAGFRAQPTWDSIADRWNK